MPATLGALAVFPLLASSFCPFLGRTSGDASARLPGGHPPVTGIPNPDAPKAPSGYVAALQELDLDAVREDLRALFKNSKDFWPADYGTYGPLMVRLAWHNSGSYRTSDGRGGVDGARQRFDPERSWADNTNLDKARTLLWPIKEKYGLGLSWGDLIVLAGNTAISSMGGPILGFCAGRIDDPSGYWSEALGPSPEQEVLAPCKLNGTCKPPLGSTTVGLIYLNPEGPLGKPIPEKSAGEVRDSFGRMAMNDSETVALIGGGHAFGKTHGACPAGAGPSPREDPINPWPGLCGTGKGKDAFTSGFEGPWTTTPTTWNNEYFKNLVNYAWKPKMGPGGHWQWTTNGTTPVAPGPQGGQQEIMMLTSDISLTRDPTGKYQEIVKLFAEDQQAFDHAFSHAWYKLTTRDMGPVTRCVGPDVPPAQPFQYPLPPTPPGSDLANFTEVAEAVRDAIVTPNEEVLPVDDYDGKKTYGPLFVRLAWQCSATFRVTDYQGGCDGARIRFSPEKDWPINVALDRALLLLKPVKEKFGKGLSWADLIVIAGTVALEEAGALPMKFCGGRTDASDGLGSQYLKNRITGANSDTMAVLDDVIKLLGLTKRQFVSLMGGGHSLGRMHMDRSGYNGSWSLDPTIISNGYFKHLLTETWQNVTLSTGKQQFKAKDKDVFMLKTDLMIKWDAELMAAAQEFASNNTLFLEEFRQAWTQVVHADRFDGPAGNLCQEE
uniref:Plant heme peroxidase family profile domain-containing protein n=1 Tax=Lotharella globosa TaxID=91324 RepID=A0A7S3YPL2_9EUKA